MGPFRINTKGVSLRPTAAGLALAGTIAVMTSLVPGSPFGTSELAAGGSMPGDIDSEYFSVTITSQTL